MQNKKQMTIHCNCCGTAISTPSQPYKDFLQVEKTWRYSSTKDSKNHKFNIFEICYNHFISRFKIPIPSKPLEENGGYTTQTLDTLNNAYAKLNMH